MVVLQLDRVSLSLAGHPILREVSWQLGERDRVGFVGPNGAGKSSLLKLLVGELTPDRGQFTRPRRVSIGYLPQQVELGLARRGGTHFALPGGRRDNIVLSEPPCRNSWRNQSNESPEKVFNFFCFILVQDWTLYYYRGTVRVILLKKGVL